jgi:hypothetical protein
MLSCCAFGGGISTAAISRLFSVRGTTGAWLLPFAYFAVLGVLLALLCSLSLMAVFGSAARKGWALAVLCVLLGRSVPPVPVEGQPRTTATDNKEQPPSESQQGSHISTA